MTGKSDKQNQVEQKAEKAEGQPPIQSTGSNFTINPILALVFIFLAEAGIICWMLSEHFSPRFPKTANTLLLLGIISLGAVGIHNVIKSGQFQLHYVKYTQKVWVVFILSCVILIGVFAIPLSPKQEKPVQPVINIQPVIQQPAYIEGTEYTRKQVEEAFPYGHAIIHLNSDGEIETREFASNPLPWQIDWRKIKIEPNFATGRVLVTVPNVAYHNAGVVVDGGASIDYSATLKTGLVSFTPIYVSNKPCLYLIILSVNPRHAVFAFGYGIWDESHPGLPGFPRQ